MAVALIFEVSAMTFQTFIAFVQTESPC